MKKKSKRWKDNIRDHLKAGDYLLLGVINNPRNSLVELIQRDHFYYSRDEGKTWCKESLIFSSNPQEFRVWIVRDKARWVRRDDVWKYLI